MEDVEEKERKFIFSYGVGKTTVETKEGNLVIPNVLYTPEITLNVLSIDQLEDQGYIVTYDNNKCSLKYMSDDGRKAVDVQGDSTMAEEDSGSLISKHNQFLENYFQSIDPKEECLLIKGIEDLQMDKEDVQDYIDDEYLSMNGTLYAMKDDEEAVKECYKDYIGMVKIYYEEAQRSKQDEGPKGMSVEIESALEGTPKKTAQVGVKMESNMEDTTDEDEQGSTSSSDYFIELDHSQGTASGGGPRCQETIRDTIAQTRFENVSKHSNDSLLAKGNTLRSDKDRMKLDELIELYTNLQNRVLDLEQTKTTQHKDITLVNDADIEMFDVDDLGGEEVFVAGQNENVVEEVVNAAQVSTAATTAIITTEEISLAQALKELKTSKPKRKEESTLQLKEKRNKPPTKAQQRKIMCTYLKNMEGYKLKDLKLKEFNSIQDMFNKAFKRVNTFEDFRTELVEGKEKRAGTELEQESTKKQKVDDDKKKAEFKQLMETIPDEEKVEIVGSFLIDLT
nr:ARID DNA-binding domain-containing protein [Tanacetum cinerariifolium]